MQAVPNLKFDSMPWPLVPPSTYIAPWNMPAASKAAPQKPAPALPSKPAADHGHHPGHSVAAPPPHGHAPALPAPASAGHDYAGHTSHDYVGHDQSGRKPVGHKPPMHHKEPIAGHGQPRKCFRCFGRPARNSY